MSEERIELARAFCKFAHLGQRDRAGAPYYLHPFHVADTVEGEDEKIVAYLHDILEDTPFKIETIEDLFGAEIADAVFSVTKLYDESYMDFVKRAKENSIGRKVKLADIEHNMDSSRLLHLTKKDIERMEKYRVAREILL